MQKKFVPETYRCRFAADNPEGDTELERQNNDGSKTRDLDAMLDATRGTVALALCSPSLALRNTHCGLARVCPKSWRTA